MNSLFNWRILALIMAAFAVFLSPVRAEMRVVTLQDKEGNQVGLYRESHALILNETDDIHRAAQREYSM